VEVKQVPRAFIQPGALKSPEEAEGQVALAPISPGEQVMANKLTTTGVALALAVPPGKRAVTVAVDQSSGVSGLLKPGDLVDILVTVEEGAQPRTFVLMQVVPVLAVGHNFSSRPAGEEKERESVFGKADEGTVTVAAMPYEAEQLAHLEQVGRLKLVLRAPGDREKIPLPAIIGRSAGKGSASGEDSAAVRRR
jgi:pilus assembly protein CpaB